MKKYVSINGTEIIESDDMKEAYKANGVQYYSENSIGNMIDDELSDVEFYTELDEQKNETV